MEIKVDVEPHIWQKFEQISGDIGKDRSQVLSNIIEEAHAKFLEEKKKAKK